MKTANATMAGIVSCAMLLGANSIHAQDWPQWLGPNRDAKATGFKAPKTWPKELTKKWQKKVGDGVATPALVGDKLYVFSRQDDNDIIRCLKSTDGDEVWQDKYPAKPPTRPAKGFNDEFVGPRSSPAVGDGKVVTFSARGILSCYEAATGKKLWRKDSLGGWPRFFISSSPLIVDSLCIVQFGDQESGGIVAYELASGKEKWKWSGDAPAYASPVLLTLDGAKVIIAETNSKIVGVAVADGKLRWETPYAVRGRGYNASTPLVDGQTVIYAGSGRGTKAVKLEKKDDSVKAKELWSNDNAVQFNTPVLTKGLVFGLDARNSLFCINAEGGKTAWTASLGGGGGGGGGGKGRGQGGYGSIVVAGTYLMALTPQSQLVVFEPSDKEFKKVASYKVADKQTFAYPVVSGNRIFVKDRDSVTLWTIE